MTPAEIAKQFAKEEAERIESQKSKMEVSEKRGIS